VILLAPVSIVLLSVLIKKSIAPEAQFHVPAIK
jgi:hypothetical protein